MKRPLTAVYPPPPSPNRYLLSYRGDGTAAIKGWGAHHRTQTDYKAKMELARQPRSMLPLSSEEEVPATSITIPGSQNHPHHLHNSSPTVTSAATRANTTTENVSNNQNGIAPHTALGSSNLNAAPGFAYAPNNASQPAPQFAYTPANIASNPSPALSAREMLLRYEPQHTAFGIAAPSAITVC